MKGLSLFVVATILMAMVSCTPNFDQPSEIYPGQKLAFEATYADDPSTKTVVQEDGKSIWWSAHEDISIFYGNSAASKFTSTNVTPVAQAVFTGNIGAFTGVTEGGEPNSFWAIYPYNEANTCDGNAITATLPGYQTGKAESFSDKQWMTMAKNYGLALSFYAVGAGFRFSVTKSGVTSVIFKGNNNEVLAGKAKIGMDANNRPIVLEHLTEVKEITLVAPFGETFEVGKLYYLAIYPTNFTKGFTIMFNTATETGTRVYDSAIDFKRTDVHKGKNFDQNVVYMVAAQQPQAVDLGLSVKWASCNVGASAPEEYGAYYAWGETTSKSYNVWVNYRFRVSGDIHENVTLSKYSTDNGRGTVDNKTTLEMSDDAARANWGGSWRMPSNAEMADLMRKCTWTWTTLQGTNGYRVTSKTNGNSIFLPAAGYWGARSLSGAGTLGMYWTSSLCTDSPECASQLRFDSDVFYDTRSDRCIAFSVRPVTE